MDKGKVAFLERFLATISPSGFEAEAAAVWREEAGKFAERTWVDLHGTRSRPSTNPLPRG